MLCGIMKTEFMLEGQTYFQASLDCSFGESLFFGELVAVLDYPSSRLSRHCSVVRKTSSRLLLLAGNLPYG